MAIIANRRSVMMLFSVPTDAQSHRTRIVLAEKDIAVEIHNEDAEHKSEDFLSINPYNVAPTLVDRDLVLYDARVIMEYLDERFPHPPLLPVDPVSRAKFRLALYRIEKDWYGLLGDLERPTSNSELAKKHLREGLIAIAPILEVKPFFLGDEFSLADCSIAPILWRLRYYGVDLPAQARAVEKYAERIFSRASFKQSLSPHERKMR